MIKKSIAYVRLQPSETAVYHVASRFVAAQIQNGSLNNENEDQIMHKAVIQAIRMANLTDKLVQSDDEMS